MTILPDWINLHYQPLLHVFFALYQSLPNKTLKHGEALLPQLMKTPTVQGMVLVWSMIVLHGSQLFNHGIPPDARIFCGLVALRGSTLCSGQITPRRSPQHQSAARRLLHVSVLHRRSQPRRNRRRDAPSRSFWCGLREP